MADSPKITKRILELNITTPDQAKAHARVEMKSWGWHAAEQWHCLERLWTKESNWRPEAQNKQPVIQIRDGKRVKLYAGGIPQILGLNPKLSVPAQVQRGFEYIKARYGSPCHARNWWDRHKWY
jgi:hypothetical protein